MTEGLRKEDTVEYRATEARVTPPFSLLLGHGPMLPFPVAALAAWLRPEWAGIATDLAILWGGAILLFFSGVRRGLSFRTAGGATAAQILMMLWLFCLGLAALAVPSPVLALVLLLAGYLSVGVLDPVAARRGEAPTFFARLRPVQMVVPVLGLAALLVLALGHR